MRFLTVLIIAACLFTHLQAAQSYISEDEISVQDGGFYVTRNVVFESNIVSGNGAAGMRVLDAVHASGQWYPAARFDILTGRTKDAILGKPYAEVVSLPEVPDVYSLGALYDPLDFTGGEYLTSINATAGNHFSFLIDLEDETVSTDDVNTFAIRSNEYTSAGVDMAMAFHDTGSVIIGGDYSALEEDTYANPNAFDSQLMVIGNIDAGVFKPPYGLGDDVPNSMKMVRFANVFNYVPGESSLNYGTGNYVIGIQGNEDGDQVGFHVFESVTASTELYAVTFDIAAIPDSGSGHKQFVIDHPSDPSRYLIHSIIEAPENRVFYRGEGQLANGEARIHLPHYVPDLVYEDTGVNIQLTALGSPERLAIFTQGGQQLKNGTFIVKSEDTMSSSDFYYEVSAIRKDVDDLLVEPLKTDVIIEGKSPYKWYKVRQ